MLEVFKIGIENRSVEYIYKMFKCLKYYFKLVAASQTIVLHYAAGKDENRTIKTIKTLEQICNEQRAHDQKTMSMIWETFYIREKKLCLNKMRDDI